MAYRTTTVVHPFPSSRLKQEVRFLGKCYAPEKACPDGPTLLFFHCAGSHKEAWEPTIQSLFAADAARGQPLIREAWSFDLPSHGESGVWNRELMERTDVEPITVDDYGEGFRHFIASGALAGHRLCGIGHSLGATAMLLATLPPHDLPPVVYETVVMVEPALIEPTVYKSDFEQGGALETTAKLTLKRRDTWDSREHAKEYFQKRFPWDAWDPRVLDVYVRHALSPVKSQEGAEGDKRVTLSCPKTQESTAYTYIAPHFRIVELFRSGMDPSIPVHWITGECVDVVPEYVHESVMALRKVASFQRVPDAGHFVVQGNPDGMAAAIYRVLDGTAQAPEVPRANL